ncbi:MAG: (deoxy)nucleoside triphosphate pyrophosphohydrolase [Olsenella sp.]|nr:(deoxy)nucleoside triphosphate pyrophosphohydrolase [Olsenella sp.]
MKTVRVVAAIIRRDDKILATQRGYGEFAGGWEFPGGKIEQGESPEDAIVREIHEELATTINVERFVTNVTYDYGTFRLDMDCFLCSLAENHVTLLEHKAARWLDVAHIDSVDWLPADVDVVGALKEQSVF